MALYKFEQLATNCTAKRTPVPSDYPYYIGLEHLDTKCLTVKRWGSDVPIKGDKLIMHKGDILLGKRNAYLRRAAIAPHDGLFSAHGMVLQPKRNVIDKDFFALFIASDYFFDEAIRISVGSLSPTINWKDLKELTFDIPDMEKQKKIAKVLWSILNTIDAYDSAVSQTQLLVKAKYIKMFGDINNGEFKYPEVELSDICFRKASTLQMNKLQDNNGKYPLFGAAGLAKNIDFYESTDPYLGVVKDGAGVGRIMQLPPKSSVLGTMEYVYPIKSVDINFLESTLNFLDIGSGVSGITIPHIYFKNYSKKHVCLPPKEKQSEFNSFVLSSKNYVDSILKKKQNLEHIYSKIITNTFLKGE